MYYDRYRKGFIIITEPDTMQNILNELQIVDGHKTRTKQINTYN